MVFRTSRMSSRISLGILLPPRQFRDDQQGPAGVLPADRRSAISLYLAFLGSISQSPRSFFG